MQQALDYIERHAIIDGIPVRDALRAALANELFGNSEQLVMRPEREWVGLTDEEIGLVSDERFVGAFWAQARLKEKNT
jgi:hypothetical protein